MCATCGCSDGSSAIITDLQSGRHVHLGGDHHHHEDHDHGDRHDHAGHAHAHSHSHSHSHDHPHDHTHTHSHASPRTIKLEEAILGRNNVLAERNRGWFAGRGILALNFMGGPGAGKTTLLERMILTLHDELTLRVIEGDQATLRDAERIRAKGCRVVQINTGAACHLDAEMVAATLPQLDPPLNSTLLIENVGNLVCPALFDLGERARVIVASVTDGDDKPQKYPHMFHSADAIVLNKIDLMPHIRFSTEQFVTLAREQNPGVSIFPVSATAGEGLEKFYDWLRGLRSPAHIG